MRKRYTVPTHIAREDSLLFGLTARQLLTLLVAGALAYQIWAQTTLLGLARLGLSGLIVQGLLIVLIGLVGLLVAFIRIAGRPTELWLLVFLRYRQTPKRYAWCSVRQVPLLPLSAGRHHQARASVAQEAS